MENGSGTFGARSKIEKISRDGDGHTKGAAVICVCGLVCIGGLSVHFVVLATDAKGAKKDGSRSKHACGTRTLGTPEPSGNTMP